MDKKSDIKGFWRFMGTFLIVAAFVGSVFYLVQPTELLAVQ
ncbi:hypothetical protein ACFL2M_02400 [Patescibacteria group bacterium]